MLSLILPFRQGRYLLIQTECVSSHWDALCFAKAYEKNTRMCQKEPNLESQIKDFRFFRLSESWEIQPMAFFILPNIGKAVFRQFFVFPMLGKLIFADFLFSQCWESCFSLIFCFPNIGKVDFCRFLIFPRGGKPIFADFRSSYPYESLLLPFFVHRTPTKASFSRFLSIVPRIWVIFREKSMICARIWVVFLIEQFSGRAGSCWSKAWKSLTFIYFNISTKLLLAQLPKML